MTAAERTALEAIRDKAATTFGRRPLALDLMMGALIGMIGGAIPAVGALNSHSGGYAGGVLAGAAMCGALVAGGVYWRSGRPLRARRALYDWELREGVVTEFVCSISAAVEIYDVDQERSTFLLQVDEHRVLYLDGQYLQDALDLFPAEHFRLARAPHSWEVLTFEAAGPRLKRVPIHDRTEIRRDDLSDGDLLDGVIADFFAPA